MPRAFIPNIDDANAEITRLDSSAEQHASVVASITAERDRARADLATVQQTLTTAQTDLTTLRATVTTLTTERDTARNDLSAAQTQHAKEMAAKEGDVIRRLAQASLPSNPVTTPPPGAPGAALTGLQRAIAANVALQTKE